MRVCVWEPLCVRVSILCMRTYARPPVCTSFSPSPHLLPPLYLTNTSTRQQKLHFLFFMQMPSGQGELFIIKVDASCLHTGPANDKSSPQSSLHRGLTLLSVLFVYACACKRNTTAGACPRSTLAHAVLGCFACSRASPSRRPAIDIQWSALSAARGRACGCEF